MNGKSFIITDPRLLPKTLLLPIDEIKFIDRTAKLIGFTVKEFMEQFDKIILEDKDRNKVVYVRERNESK